MNSDSSRKSNDTRSSGFAMNRARCSSWDDAGTHTSGPLARPLPARPLRASESRAQDLTRAVPAARRESRSRAGRWGDRLPTAALRPGRGLDDGEAMDSALLLAALSTLACVALALAVALRRERSALTPTAVALLFTTALWSGGLGVVNARGPVSLTALWITGVGTFGTTGLWLLLALRYRWPRRFRGAAPTAIAIAPAALLFVGVVNTDRLGSAMGGGTFSEAGWGWLTHLLVAWAFACIAAGAALFGESAVRLWRQGERRSGLALLIAMSAQPVLYFANLRGVVDLM